jgi:SAM-dependent methyltransferase
MQIGREIDLLRNYPKAKRDLTARGNSKTEADREIARKFGEDFFDGDRRHGYGGFSYSSRFWQPVIPDFKAHWSLSAESSILDVGCAKGFMLYDFQQLIPGISVTGIDISKYAIDNALPEVKDNLSIGCASQIDFDDNSFDVVISINTIHNLDIDGCAQALREIERVQRKGSFITVDAYRNAEEKERMLAWNLTAKTIMSVDEWRIFFGKCGYTGDFYWFIP